MFFTLFSKAWKKAASVKTAQAGFRGTGMFPVDIKSLGEWIFEPAVTSERPLQPEQPEPETEPEPEPEISEWIGGEVVVGEEATPIGPTCDKPFIPPVIEVALPLAGCEQEDEGVTFSNLIKIPMRNRWPTKKRAKPPSYVLTSNAHFEYIEKKKPKKSKSGGKKGKTAIKKARVQPGSNSEGDDVCRLCKLRYGAAEDPKKEEEWMKCDLCDGWFHQTCAEIDGVFDDTSFTCRGCMLRGEL